MKYNVYVRYATCVQVDADDEEDAVEAAKAMLDNMDDGTFRSIIEVSEAEAEEVEE